MISNTTFNCLEILRRTLSSSNTRASSLCCCYKSLLQHPLSRRWQRHTPPLPPPPSQLSQALFRTSIPMFVSLPPPPKLSREQLKQCPEIVKKKNSTKKKVCSCIYFSCEGISISSQQIKKDTHCFSLRLGCDFLFE
jgi:hypothetical protein